MKITYEGPPAIAGLFAQLLRDDGIEVSFDPPKERRDGTAEVAVKVVMFLADKVGDAAVAAALGAAVAKLKGRFPRAKVTDEDGKDIEPPTRRTSQQPSAGSVGWFEHRRRCCC
jgi:hypothetical protein